MIPSNLTLPADAPMIQDGKMRPMFLEAEKLFGDKKLIGVEVGTSCGYNAKQVLSEWENVEKLWCIDYFPIYSDFRFQEDQDKNLEVLTRTLIDYPKAHLIIDKSVEVAKKFEDESVDFVYIDANHSYTFIRDDIQAWLPKIKKGGIIGGHDYDWTDIENGDEVAVKKAVDEAFGDKVNYRIVLFQEENRVDRYNPYTGINSDWWVFL